MGLILGLLILLALNVYVGLLSYTLRAYSRARVAERLPGEPAQGWLDWLDRYEEQLKIATGFFRLVANFGVLTLAVIWYEQEVAGSADLAHLLPPTIITLVVLVVLNIGLAHALAVHAGEAVFARSFWVLAGLRILLWPFAQALMGVDFIVRRLLGKSDETEEEETERLEEEILDAVSEGKALGAVDETQEEMIEAVFALHDTTVSAIMTPRTDMVAISVDATLDEVRETVIRVGHSRIPVIEDSLDQIIGVLYAKDLVRLRPGDAFRLRDLLRSVPYVPESKTISDLLREFQQKKVHIAIVLDEYGGTAGLVTIEDILEEIVGEIDDEYDKSTPPPMSRVDADTVELDGRVHISEVNSELDVSLPEDGDYETIGGFVSSLVGRIPVTGEELDHDNLHIRVVAADERKINRLQLRVTRPEKQPAT